MSVGIMLAVAVVSAFCVHLLLLCAIDLQKRGKPISNFEEIGHEAFGRRGSQFAAVFVVITQASFATAYVIYTCTLLVNFYDGIQFWMYAFMLLPILLSLANVRKWNWLAPGAIFALIGILLAASFTIAAAVGKFSNESVDLLTLLNRIQIGGAPVAFGTLVYIFEGIGLVVPVYKAMKSPQHFEKVKYIRGIENLIY